VVEGEVRIGGQEHFYLEPQGSVVLPGENDEMVVISSTQVGNARVSGGRGALQHEPGLARVSHAHHIAFMTAHGPCSPRIGMEEEAMTPNLNVTAHELVIARDDWRGSLLGRK
jgi:hypothetical protein